MHQPFYLTYYRCELALPCLKKKKSTPAKRNLAKHPKASAKQTGAIAPLSEIKPGNLKCQTSARKSPIRGVSRRTA